MHLSQSRWEAGKVGQRHGRPIVLVIDAARMYADGSEFYLSANDVWLTDHVPAEYICFPKGR